MLGLSTLIAQGTLELGTFKPATEAYSEGSETTQGALSNLESLISNLIGLLTALGAIMFVIYFIVGAFEWITSGGDKGKLEKARNRMLQGMLGMILVVASYSLLGLLSGVIGIDFLNPAKQIEEIIAPISR